MRGGEDLVINQTVSGLPGVGDQPLANFLSYVDLCHLRRRDRACVTARVKSSLEVGSFLSSQRG